MDGDFIGEHEAEFAGLASAVAGGDGGEIGGAASALLVKVLTGSSIVAGAAEKAAIRVFGKWLADNPDARLKAVAERFAATDRKREHLRDFAALVQPMVAYAVGSLEASLVRLEQGERRVESHLRERTDDLEALMGQSLRSAAELTHGQAEIKGLLERLHSAQTRGSGPVAVAFAGESVAGADAAHMADETSGMAPPLQAVQALVGERLDFFVSYAASDEPWAEWIAWVLEASPANYRVKLQKWDFKPGTNFVVQMHLAASQAERTIAVLSPAYFASKFGAAEWAAAFVRDPMGEEGKLVPVRIADCHPPGLLAPIVYVDLLGKDVEAARDELLTMVQRGRHKPARVDFPGNKSTSIPTSTSQPAFPGSLPAVWTVPFRSNPFFAERQHELSQLRQALQPGQAAVVAVHGPPGIGKTQLAAHYAFTRAPDYDAVLWVVADSAAALQANFAALTHDRALSLPERLEKEQDSQVAAVLRWLRSHERWLLVLDNADTTEACGAVEALIANLPRGHILVTSWRSAWPITIIAVSVRKFEEEAAVRFLITRTARAGLPPIGSVSEALAIAREVECVPVALEQAAAYALHKRIRFGSYLEILRSKMTEALRYAAEGATNYDRSAMATWLVAEGVLSPEAKAVLKLACFLAPAPIPRGLFDTDDGAVFRDALAAVDGVRTSHSQTFEDLDSALVELADYSLIDLSATEISCHRLMMAAQRETIGVEQSKPWISLALRMIDRATAGADPADVRSWPRWRPLQPHVDAVVHAADRCGIAEPTLRLMNNLASLLEATNRLSEAEPLFRRALAIGERSYGAGHPQVGALLHNLASLLRTTNRPAEAEPLFRRALAIGEASYGSAHPRIATTLKGLAHLLHVTNRMSEAEPLVRRALAIEEATYGADHPEVAAALNNLGSLLQATNRMSEAEPLLRRALAINEASYGSDHPEVAGHLSNLAHLLQTTNRAAEAEPLMRRALAINEASYGPDHRQVAICLNNLAHLLGITNRMAEAEPLIKRAIRIGEATFGPNHPQVATFVNNLALLLQGSNRLSEAEILIRRALAIDEASYGSEHPHVAIRLSNLAQLLQATKRVVEAEPLVRRALEIDEASYGSVHPAVALDLNNLAGVLRATNRMSEAVSRMRQALAIDEASYGSMHPGIVRDLHNLAGLLFESHCVPEAESLFRRALAIVEASYGSVHPGVVQGLNNLGRLLRTTDRMSEAEPLFRRALAIDEARLGSMHPTVADDLNNLAGVLRATDRMSEAEPLLRRALSIDEATYGSEHPAVARDLNNLGGLLRASNRLAEAEPLLRRAQAIRTLRSSQR